MKFTWYGFLATKINYEFKSSVVSKIVHSIVFFFNTIFPLVLELYYDRGNHHEFVSLVKDLARPGEITQSQTFDFEFTHVEKPYESYTGQNVKLR